MKYPVSQKKIDDLEKRMQELGIDESDIEELFARSSGKGGQKVNTSDSCVYIKHKPTGIEIRCSEERSQGLNRFLARRRLVQKIDLIQNREKSEKQKQIEKIRRQKRRRSKRAREKMLENKRKQSEKKERRKKIEP